MTNYFTLSSPWYILDTFFTRHISSEHSDTKMAFFTHTNQEKINFVRDLSLSQQHTLGRPGNRCFLPCFEHKRTFKWSYRWNHELKVKTYIKQISCEAKSTCFNPFTRCYNTSDEAEGWWLLNCLYGRRDSTHLGDKKCILFHTIGVAYNGVSCYILSNFDWNYYLHSAAVTNNLMFWNVSMPFFVPSHHNICCASQSMLFSALCLLWWA